MAGHLAPILNQIEQHLRNDSDARCWIIGLRALREVVRGLQEELDESRKPLFALMDRFLPMLERILQISASNESPTQLETMILILKIFHLANHLQLLPCMMQMDRLTPWIEFMVNILDVRLPDNDYRQKQTNSTEEIEKLDKEDWWKLKGICCKISLKLYQRFTNDHRLFDSKVSITAAKRSRASQETKLFLA